MAVLAMLKTPEALSVRNHGWLLLLQGVVHSGLGNLPQAIEAVSQAVTIFQQTIVQDPSNTEWQRDLYISHEKMGNMLAAQGQGSDALAAYRQGLAIAERLAAQDPSHVVWQTDLVVSYWKLAQFQAMTPADLAGRREFLQRGLAILYLLWNEAH